MKIRTKLVLLLSTALVVTMVTATWLRIRWTRQALETNARQRASETALAIAADLEQYLKDLPDNSDYDDISERLKYEVRRYRADAVELTLDSEEENTVSFNLDFKQEDPRIASMPRRTKPQRPANQRREEARRALWDHGGGAERPGERGVEPLWRTPDKPVSQRWARLAPRQPAPAPRRPTQALLVDLRDAKQKQEQRYLEVVAPVDPDGPRHGQLTVRVSLENVDRLIGTEEKMSALVTGAAVVLLVLLTLLIADRVVGRPVSELGRAMHEVEQGDLHRRVEERRADEIGALSRGFNSMLSRLGEANDEIRAFNRRLADEVSAATTDLARKNEALGHLNRLLVETQRELGDKERLAALGQLAAQLAHELGTPLGSVSGHLQLAMSSAQLPGPLKERLQVATRELERVSKIVRDYLDSTRPVAPARVACDVERVIDEALGIALGAQAQARPGLAVERHIDPEATNLVTDAGLVRQILINLLTNAIDATGSEKGRIVLSVTAAAGAVEIAVADDGVGISAEDAARIFEPFYTTKGRGKGTGLGLAICRELATALGGRLSVTSEPGVGSTFTVRLPHETARIVVAADTPQKVARS